MHRSQWAILASFALVVGAMYVYLRPPPIPRASGAMQEGTMVPAETGTLDPKFKSVTYIGAEVSWTDKTPRISRTAPDYGSLRTARVPIGASLKIAPTNADLDPAGLSAKALAELARSIVDEAKGSFINLSELQIDFESPAARLDEYRMWVEAVRRKVAPTPVTITAMSDWLDRRAFKSLVTSADGFILKLNPYDAAARLDPAAARRAVETAGALGIPFRIALPSPGIVALDAAGAAFSLAEHRTPPLNRDARTGRQSPFSLDFLKDFTANRPATLKGILWNWETKTIGKDGVTRTERQ